jgi:hypothetical protein
VNWKSVGTRIGLMAVLLGTLVGCVEATSPTPTATKAVSLPSVTPLRSPEATSTASTPVESPSPTPVPQPSSTPLPSPTPSPAASPTVAADGVVVRETSLSIATYVYEPFLRDRFDDAHGVPYVWLDRDAYGEPTPDSTVLTPFRAVVMENRYLRLTILPELGGRLYECFFKPTGQNLFYRNLVLKPTRWGPLAREQNWWLAAGGMEWAFPVYEHGYESGIPWSYSVERSASETKIVVRDTTEVRPRMSVEIGLAPDTAYFTISPHVENPTDSSVSYQYWTSAVLTLGGSSVSPNTEFVYPTDEIVLHSTGPLSGLPGERAVITWPVWEGRDLSWYHSWEDYLGFFLPEPSEDFVGAYNHDTGLGIVRVFDRRETPGVKLFAWGQDSVYTSEYTDDGSEYFEMWGGPNRTFWPEDDNTLGPGESQAWTEYWYPFQGTDGLVFANRDAALSLTVSESMVSLGLASTSLQEGTVVVEAGGSEVYRREIAIGPESPHVDSVSLPSDLVPGTDLSFTYISSLGEVLVSYVTEIADR